VTDTGIGMTPEQLGKLFQVFEQADKSTSKNTVALALGWRLAGSFASSWGASPCKASWVRGQLLR
jgi:two-component system sensor histidine kinase/response regulator